MESARHSIFRPDCNSTADVSSLTLRTALSAIPFVSDLCGVNEQWFQDNSSQDCQKQRNCQSTRLLVSSSTPRTALGSSGSPGKILFCTGRLVPTGLLSLAPPRQSVIVQRFTTLWSSAINSPKFSALGTTAVASLRQFVILVFKHFSQFGSFGKCVNTLCLPDTDSMYARGIHWRCMRRTKCLHSFASSLADALMKNFHKTNSPWIPVANQVFHAIHLFVVLSIPYFNFGFRLLWNHSTSLTEALHSYLPLSDTAVSTSLFYNTESLFSDVDSCAKRWWRSRWSVIEEELADIPGTTNGT